MSDLILLRLAEILESIEIDDDIVTIAFTPFERDLFVSSIRAALQQGRIEKLESEVRLLKQYEMKDNRRR